MKNWVETTYKMNIDEISTYNFPKNEYFGLEIIENNVKYEFIIKISSESKGLLCLGPGVIDQKTKSIPRFQRYRWKDDFEESVIYYFDPTLYLDPKLGACWCMGTKDDWYLEKISKIIEKIVYNGKIKNENILFYGTSMGGFVSAMLSTMIKGSSALVGNFQYSIFKVHTKKYLNDVKEVCFQNLDDKTLLEKYGYRFNLIKMFKKENYVPPIIYYVNANSKADILLQCIPFIKGLEKLDYSDNDVEIIIYHDQNGHQSRISYEEAYPLIQMVLKRKIYRYYNRSSFPDKRIEALSKENHTLKLELEKIKSQNNTQKKTPKNNNIIKKIKENLLFIKNL